LKAGRAEILAAYDALNPVAFGELATRAGGAVVERDGVLLARGPEPAGVIVNGAFRRDRHTPAARVLELARDHFADGFGFTLWAPAHRDADIDQAARTAGWRMIVELPIMAIANPIAAAAPAPDVVVRDVDPGSAADVGSFAHIAGTTLGDDEEERDAYRRCLRSADLYRDGCRGVIAAVDGADAAVAWTLIHGPTAIVGWVGTLDGFRRRGLGELVTRAVTNWAFGHGATLVTLQASTMGRPIYERMGYETVSSERLFVPPAYVSSGR
jgi:GNAT superfamily N-acetyltransferase